MTPEPAQTPKHEVQPPLSSPRDAKELEEFWLDIGRRLDAKLRLQDFRNGLQRGSKSSEGEQDG